MSRALNTTLTINPGQKRLWTIEQQLFRLPVVHLARDKKGMGRGVYQDGLLFTIVNSNSHSIRDAEC